MRIFFSLLITFLFVNQGYSQTYICASTNNYTYRSPGEWDFGSNFCDFDFSAVVEPSSAGYVSSIYQDCNGCGGRSLQHLKYDLVLNPSYTGGLFNVKINRKGYKGLSCKDDPDRTGNLQDDNYYKEHPAGNFNFGSLTLNGNQTNSISVIRQYPGSISLVWNNGTSNHINRYSASYTRVSPSGFIDQGTYYSGVGGSIALPIDYEGTYNVTVQMYNDDCGTVYTWGTVAVNVLPACANDAAPGTNINIIDVTGINGTSPPTTFYGGYNDNALWKDGGGYEVDQNTTLNPKTYRITFNNVTEFGNYYNITVNGTTTDIPFTRNGTSVDFNVNASIGWYEFSIQPSTTSAVNFCRSYPNLNVFVGGSNTTFQESCLIYLPQYLIDKGVVGANNVAQHFRSTVLSSQGIICEPEVVLMDGAELKIIEPDFDFQPDIDNHINITHTRIYDDYGRIISESRNYFDDMGRATQAQTKNLTAGVVLASQNIYDKFGRLSISTLAAPVSAITGTTNSCGLTAEPWESLTFTYQPNFIVKQGGGKYDYTAFDNYGSNSTIENNPRAVEKTTPGSLGWYYSINNSATSTSALKEPYTPTSSYPYSRILYKADGTNEVLGTASPGDYHRAGAGHVPITTKDVVTSADDTWLNRYLTIRNTEIMGYTTTLSQFKANVFKVTSTDTEGNQSVNYINKEGQNLISLYVPSGEASFVFYDDANRLRFSITPNGVKQYFGLNEYTTAVSFGNIDKSEYIYNHKGWLLKSIEKDKGITQFMYRKDGMLRFSQNQEQAVNNKFSYTNYDRVNRAIESGEFLPSANSGLETFGYGNNSLTSILEYGTVNYDLSDNTKGNKVDWIKIHYDFADPLGISDAEFVNGNTSFTENASGNKTWYSFDERRRVVKIKKNIISLGAKLFEYKYDQQGNIKEIAYQRALSDAYYHYYEYTSDGSLSSVFSGIVAPIYNGTGDIQNKVSLIKQAEYFYYKHGPLKRVDIREGLQGIDYVYTIQGWLKSINNHDKSKDPSADSDDLFGMSLEYFNGDYNKNNVINVFGLTNTEYFNGNIRAMNWFSAKPASSTISASPTSYAYEYDNKFQLVDAKWNTVNTLTNTVTSAGNAYREGTISYDANGNIKGLGRYNNTGVLINDFLPVGVTDKFIYTANSNKLSSVTGYATYTYNNIGQVSEIQSQATTKDMQMTYNISGLTKKVDISGDPNVSKVVFVYDEAGQRIKKEVYDNSSSLVNEVWYVYNGSNLLSTYSTDINGTINQDEFSIYGNSKIGTAYKSGSLYSYIYDIRDNVGNTRVRFVENAGSAEVKAFYDYYPYGDVINNRNAKGTNITRNEYQGEFAEKDDETELNAFKLRMYDPVIGRWIGPDIYRQYYSSYVGMGNNPVSGIDPDGGFSWLGAIGYKLLNGGGNIVKDEERGEWYVQKYSSENFAEKIEENSNRPIKGDVVVLGNPAIYDWTKAKRNIVFQGDVGLVSGTIGATFTKDVGAELRLERQQSKGGFNYATNTGWEKTIVKPSDGATYGFTLGKGDIGVSYDFTAPYVLNQGKWHRKRLDASKGTHNGSIGYSFVTLEGSHNVETGANTGFFGIALQPEVAIYFGVGGSLKLGIQY